MDCSELVGIWSKDLSASDRITISRYIRTDVGAGIRFSAGAVVGEVRELGVADQPEVALDSAFARGVGSTEPSSVSGRAVRDTRKAKVGVSSIGLGASSGGIELRLPGRRTANERGPFLVGAGDGESYQRA